MSFFADGFCEGTSPTGLRWLYLQPQHTATVTVIKSLSSVYNLSCRHSHNLPSQELLDSIDIAFSFARNPFQRLLSSAALDGAIGGAFKSAAGNSDVEVKSFRSWCAGMAAARRRPILQASELYRATRTRFLGRTSTLEHDLKLLLVGLGYLRSMEDADARGGALASHCISSCREATQSRLVTRGAHTTAEKARRNDWFDEPCKRYVLEYYEPDFAGSVLDHATSGRGRSSFSFLFPSLRKPPERYKDLASLARAERLPAVWAGEDGTWKRPLSWNFSTEPRDMWSSDG
jgi:hypothetical protein